jgi:hypothetical protein
MSDLRVRAERLAVGASYRRIKRGADDVLQRPETPSVVDLGPAFALRFGFFERDASEAEHHDLQ